MNNGHYKKFNPEWGWGEKGRDWRAWDPKWSCRGALGWRGLVSREVGFQTYWKWSPKERGALEHSGKELGRRLRVSF